MRPDHLSALAMATLRRLAQSPATALDVAHELAASPVAVLSAVSRMRRHGLVVRVRDGSRGRYGATHMLVQAAPGALCRVTRQKVYVDPPLPPEPERPELPRYVPSVVLVGGVACESYSGRVPLSAYAGASSLVGTARWGCA